MPFSRSSLGIDLREDRVIFCLVRKSFGRVWVASKDVSVFSPEKGREERNSEFVNALRGFLRSQSVARDRVVLSLPREKALLRIVEIPSAAKENLRKVLEYELAKYIPFAPDEAVFDFQLLKEKEGFLRILLVVMKKEELDEALELLKRVGLRPMVIEISSTASVNLIAYDRSPLEQQPIVLADIGKRFFELQFFEKGEYSEAIHGSFRDQRERTRELMESYRLAMVKGVGAKDGNPVVYAYGEDLDASFLDDLKRDLSPHVTWAHSFKKIKTATGLLITPDCYPSVGLGLRGVQKTKWMINLLPQSLRKKVSRVGLYLAIFLSLIALGLAATWGIRPYLQEREELVRLTAEVKEKKPRVEALEAVQTRKGAVEKEIREFESLVTDETSRLEILRELSEILPTTVWIWNLKLKSRDLEINGFANSASDLIAILDKSALFEKVEFSSPVTKERRLFGEQTEKERFRISAKIERRK